MDIILAVVRQVVIENNLHVIHVNAAGGDVGGDEEIKAGFAEFLHDSVAHHLGHVAVEPVGGITLGVEVVHQIIHHALGVAKDDAELEVVEVNEPGEQINFEAPVHLVIHLFDRRDGEGLLLEAHLLRVARVFLNQLLDGPRNGGGEKDGLPLLGRGLKDEFNVVAEAHVEHDVHFVEDDHFDGGELEGAAAHVIHDAARRADDNVGALAQTGQLAVIGLAAIDRQGMEAALEERQLVDLLGNLDGQFARGAEDEHLGVAPGHIHFFDGRRGERHRLARPGLRLAGHILALHQEGDGLRLDGRGLLEAELADGLQQFGRQAQFRK